MPLLWHGLLKFAVDVILPGDKGSPLGVNEPLDFDVILIIPVLMFTGLVTKGACAGHHDGALKHVPVLFNISWILFGQIGTKSSQELLLVGGVSQPFEVELWPALLFQHPSLPHEADRHDGANEPWSVQ